MKKKWILPTIIILSVGIFFGFLELLIFITERDEIEEAFFKDIKSVEPYIEEIMAERVQGAKWKISEVPNTDNAEKIIQYGSITFTHNQLEKIEKVLLNQFNYVFDLEIPEDFRDQRKQLKERLEKILQNPDIQERTRKFIEKINICIEIINVMDNIQQHESLRKK